MEVAVVVVIFTVIVPMLVPMFVFVPVPGLVVSM
jgi:hypothetical protein